MSRLTAEQHLRNALTDLVKARAAEKDGGYKLDIQVLIDDLLRELRTRGAAPKPKKERSIEMFDRLFTLPKFGHDHIR